MSVSSQATRPGDTCMGRGAFPARIRRHHEVRETLIIGCSIRQDSSWNFVELIQNLFKTPVWGGAR